MQIFSGSSNKKLGQTIAKELKTKLGQISLTHFPNQESRIWIKQKVESRVILVQSFSGAPNDSIIEYCLIMDALKRAGATNITVIIPWLGYSIQDKVFRKGESLSVKIIAEIINYTRPDRVLTFDLHNPKIIEYFTNPITELSAVPSILGKLKQEKIDCVVAPDKGALPETTKTAYKLNLPTVLINKKRNLNTGKTQILDVEGDVDGKTALIMDDFISTGSTLIQTAKFLKSQNVKKVIVGITHHLFVKGVQKKLSQSPINQLFISDTIQKPSHTSLYNNEHFNTQIVSIADIIIQNL